MIDPNFIEGLSKFNLIVHKRVTSNFVGARRSLATGHGLTFEDHQPYASGEDYRRIDWNVYARTDNLFVRRFEEDKSLTVRILLDSSASMKFRKKWDYSSMISLGFAYLTMRENEKFQIATFDKDLLFLRAKKGKENFSRMINKLNSLKVSGQGKFLENMRKLKTQISTKSLIVIVSDFLYDIEEISVGLRLLSKHELEVIQIFDEKEMNLNYKGRYKFKDPESSTEVKTFITPRIQNKYQDELGYHIAQVRNVVESAGGKYSLVSTEKSIFDVFYDIMKSS
jgi:uncharacterized protein (DUF58 family)